MVRGGNTEGMVGLLLVLSAIAQCAPTLSEHGIDAAASGCRLSSPEETQCLGLTGDVAGLAHSRLADVADEFHRHPVISTDAFVSVDSTKSFPPVPSALLMVLTGFLCISLVRDRRVWLAALMCLLWAGQTGLSLLPRLASSVAGERHRALRSPNCPAGRCRSIYMCRSCSEIEGTCYAYLFRNLAGTPEPHVSTSLRVSVRSLKVQSSSDLPEQYWRSLCRGGFGLSARSLSRIRVDRGFRPLEAIIAGRGPVEASRVNHLPLGEGPFVRLASILVCTNLARGPPSLGQIANLFSC